MTIHKAATKHTQQYLVKFSKVFSCRNGALEMEFKILFGSLKMDSFPQTKNQIRDLKSMSLERSTKTEIQTHRFDTH